MLPNGLKCIQNYDTWSNMGAHESSYPLFTVQQFVENGNMHPRLNFVQCNLNDLTKELLGTIKNNPKVVLVAFSDNRHAMAELRRAFFVLLDSGLDVPVIIRRNYSTASEEEFQVYASTDAGALMLEGMGDGICLSYNRPEYQQVTAVANSTSFGILQASRTRITRTEYISCPSCGRTLFDLQKTMAKIRERTDHLKGVKIAIMGCIVNGPGEMADADYGYVGAGIDKITLYKGKEVVKKGIPFDAAVDELITLIKNGGDWVDT
jgi:(E)-4-hydroxy-3-methylbut-2-enyl-diphosphate synthase